MSNASESTELTWHACPALQSPLKAVFAFAVIGGLAWGTAAVSESPLAGLAAAGGLILVLHRFYFPSKHTIDATGVQVSTLLGTQSLTWDRINHVGHDGTRVYLSPRSTAGADGGRGLLLLLKENHDEVLAAITAWRQASDKFNV